MEAACYVQPSIDAGSQCRSSMALFQSLITYQRPISLQQQQQLRPKPSRQQQPEVRCCPAESEIQINREWTSLLYKANTSNKLQHFTTVSIVGII